MFKIEKELLEHQDDCSHTEEGLFLLRQIKSSVFPSGRLSQARYVLKMNMHDQVLVFVDFVNLTQEEQLRVWRWRNHVNVRRWMYQSESFSLSEHLAFIQSLVRCCDKQYFLIKKQQQDLGVIDFVNIDFKNKSCEFGLYVNPDRTLPGTGRVLEAAAIQYAFELLKLETIQVTVFCDNQRSLNLHRKCGFKITGQQSFNKKDIFSMRLHKKESDL